MSQAVAKRSAKSAAMLRAGMTGRDLMGGTRGMRAAGRAYLPKMPQESEEGWQERLAASWLFNGYRKTVRDMVGRVFDKPVELVEGPSAAEEWEPNIDLAGRDLSTFAKDVFTAGLHDGIAWVLVDAPARTGEETRAQAAEQNLRPYLNVLTIEDVLGWQARSINNVMTLTQFRILEAVQVEDPEDEFAEAEVAQVRVLDRTEAGVQVRLYRQQPNSEQWVLYQEPTFTGLPEISVVP
ncbi:MAG: DNA-binding protein, partial [Pseudomonadota bacterium]